MTIDQMMMFSHVLLGFTIFFLIVAIIVFFLFDVRRAWRILTGKKISTLPKKKEAFNRQGSTTNQYKRNNVTTEILKRQDNNQYKGNDITTALKEIQAKTTLLINRDENDSKDNIVMDITLIHTEIML